MSQSQDEARAARIQKYKEERRKQLTARTATLFSANVTERRPRKVGDRCQSDDAADYLKSSSELNLNTASTSVPIRTTRASRLRAAATVHSDTSPSPKKSNRSSSVQSLIDDAKSKSSKVSKIVDRDKPRTANRRQSYEKENLKTTTDKDIGAIKSKPKHSTNKTILEKDRSNFIVSSPKGKSNSKFEERKNRNSLVEQKKLHSMKIDDKSKRTQIDEEQILNDILDDKGLSDSCENEKIENLFNDLVVEDKNTSDDKIGLKKYIPVSQEDNTVNKVVTIAKLEHSGVVPKVVKDEEVGGLLGAVCVRKVERFSELLSNLCSPCEADILFQDILAENGIDANSVSMELDINEE